MWLFIKNLFFTIFVPGFVAGVIPLTLVTKGAALPGQWTLRHMIALVLVLAGAAVLLRSIWSFAVTGRGTLAPLDPPKTVVVTGLYRYVRNPMYVAVLTVILGEALFFASWRAALYGAFIAGMFHWRVVFHEEPALERRFGDSFRHYRARVRRWLPGPPYRNGD